MRSPILSLFILLVGCSQSRAGLPTGIAVGETAPEFSLTDLAGQTVTLQEHRGKTVVLEWFNPGCPFVKVAHEPDGPLATLAADKADEVTWLAINSGAPGKQGHGVDTNREAAARWKMTHQILLDPDGQTGQAYGARTTPHMYIVDPGGKVMYAGALDNAPMGRRADTYVNYVNKALGELQSGTPIRTPQTKPYGCSVKY